MDKNAVLYLQKESRTEPGKMVDCMRCHLDDTELYAERPLKEDGSNYDALKADILKAADDKGIDADRLDFIFE